MDESNENGADVLGEGDQPVAACLGEGAGRRRHEECEHDQREEGSVRCGGDRVGRDQAQDEVEEAGELLGGLLDYRCRDGHGPDSHRELHEPHSDDDGGDGRAPEKAEGGPPELSHRPRVSEAGDPDEDGRHHEGDDHHSDRVDEQCAQGCHPGSQAVEQIDVGSAGEEPECEAQDQPEGGGAVIHACAAAPTAATTAYTDRATGVMGVMAALGLFPG